MYKLPKQHRPGGFVKVPTPGLDLPSAFLDELKSIDQRLWVIWEPYRCEKDVVLNTYTGKLDDPRFCIHLEDGTGSQEIWGWPLRMPDNSPIPENRWHIYELTQFGWCHTSVLLSTEPAYLALLAHRLYLQARFSDKYGKMKYVKNLQEQHDEEKEKAKRDLDDLNNAVMQENSWLVKRAMENFEYGRVKPTNPTKDIIMSGPGISNKSRIIRPLTDEEGGLVTLDKLN